MKVMQNHDWFDEEFVEYVDWAVEVGGHKDLREIGFKNGCGALLISKEDVIALAKEFNLIVFEEDSKL